MLLHCGGTCKLGNVSQRQPESSLLLQPAKYNTDMFLSNPNEERFFFFFLESRKESLVSFGIANLSHHLLRPFHGLFGLTQRKK